MIASDAGLSVISEVASSSQNSGIVPTLSIVAYGSNHVNDRLSVSEVSSSNYVNATVMSIQVAASPEIDTSNPGSSGNAGTMVFFSDAYQAATSTFLMFYLFCCFFCQFSMFLRDFLFFRYFCGCSFGLYCRGTGGMCGHHYYHNFSSMGLGNLR